MITTLDSRRRKPIDRSGDRLVALIGIALAVAFLAAALLSAALPVAARRGVWLPLHLALAGGASTAIAAVLPFFVAAFAAAPPARTSLRGGSVAAVAFGALLVTTGVVGSIAQIAVAGGLLFIAGVCLVAASSLTSLGSGLGPRGGVVTRAYLLAIAMVTTGALLATLLLAKWPPVVEAWERLRPAHAWLNLVGFVSLVIAATLLHFFPTVVGSRIAAHPSARVAVISLSAAPIVAAVGYTLGLGLVVQAGAAVAFVGAASLAVYASRIWMRRAQWTSDLSWHLFAIGGLGSAMGWFVAGTAILFARTIGDPSPAGWSIEPVIAPLIVGWVGIAILASATHLMPAVGPGDHLAHARQRVVLGRWTKTRLITLDVGVAGLALGLEFGDPGLANASTVAVAIAFAITSGLIVRAVVIGLRRQPVDH